MLKVQETSWNGPLDSFRLLQLKIINLGTFHTESTFL